MDKKYISEILSIIKNSNSGLRELEIRDVKYNDATSDKSTLYIEVTERIGFSVPLSRSWIVENQLVFSLFDGYLEDKYSLEEGSSFKSRYTNLPAGTNMEIVCKNCYRIMKIFRNAVTHSLSHIVVDELIYKINYENSKKQMIRLEITKSAVKLLYTLIVAFVEGKIEISTQGHYEGILISYYRKMLAGITVLEDDLFVPLIGLKYDIVDMNSSVRYRILNPRVSYENGELRVQKYNPGCEQYACDYRIERGKKTFLIPEEIMSSSGEYLVLPEDEMGEMWSFPLKNDES